MASQVTVNPLVVAPAQPFLVADQPSCGMPVLQTDICTIGDDAGLVIADTGHSTVYSCDGAHSWPGVGPNDLLSFGADYSVIRVAGAIDPMSSLRALQVARFDATGAMVSQKLTDVGAEAAAPYRVRVGQDGSIYALGAKSGQLPGSSVALSDQPFFARFDAEGNVQWIEQLPKPDAGFWFTIEFASPFGADVDAAGNWYVAGYILGEGIGIEKVGQDGTGLWRRKIMLTPALSASLDQSLNELSVSPDGSALFLRGFLGTERLVVKTDINGNPQWAVTVQVKHQTVVDPVERLTWTGGIPTTMSPFSTNLGRSAVGADAVFLIGNYLNQYTNGSNPPPPFMGIYGVAIAYDGSVKWANQYRVGPLVTATGETGSSDGTEDHGFRVLPSGDLAIGARITNATTVTGNGNLVGFKVKADGTIL